MTQNTCGVKLGLSHWGTTYTETSKNRMLKTCGLEREEAIRD